MWEGGGSFPYGGIFFMLAVFSPRGGHAIFSVCVWGGFHFLHGGGGHYWVCPHNNFCGSFLLSQIFLIFPDRRGLTFFEGAIRSTQKTSPPPPPGPAPITINNLCPPPPPHSQYFSFTDYYHYPITPPGPACSLRNNLNMLKSPPPSLTPPPPLKKRKI